MKQLTAVFSFYLPPRAVRSWQCIASFPCLAKKPFASIGLKKQHLEDFFLKCCYIEYLNSLKLYKGGASSLRPIHTKESDLTQTKNPTESIFKPRSCPQRQGTRSHLPRCGMKMACTSPPWVPPLRKSGGREVGGGLWIPGVIKVGADEFLG